MIDFSLMTKFITIQRLRKIVKAREMAKNDYSEKGTIDTFKLY